MKLKLAAYWDVLIPFIAGQWSLRARAEAEARSARFVLIPFIAGQWSLRADEERLSAELAAS